MRAFLRAERSFSFSRFDAAFSSAPACFARSASCAAAFAAAAAASAAAVGGLGGDDGSAAEESEDEVEGAVAAVERGVLEEQRREGGGAVDEAPLALAAEPLVVERRPLAHRPSRDEHDELLSAAGAALARR